MKINKILNNNYVTSSSDEMGEVVIMGPGVGFRKKIGDDIDSKTIEKTFCITTGKETNISGSIHYKLARKIVKKASKKWHAQFYDEVIGMIANYLSFVMQAKDDNKQLFRSIKDEQCQNDFESEIIKYIKEKTNVELSNTEIKYISQCLKNYLIIETFNKNHIDILFGEIVHIIEKTFSIKIKKDQSQYGTFKNNILLLAESVIKFEGERSSKKLTLINESKSSKCTNIVSKFISDKYKYNLSVKEIIFLDKNIEEIMLNCMSRQNIVKPLA